MTGNRLVPALALMALAGPAAAQLPGSGACFAQDYDAAHLAAHPRQTVAGLRLWFVDEYVGDPDSRMLILQALMADEGPARRDGVGGMTLRATLFCDDAAGLGPGCSIECDGGRLDTRLLPDGGLEITTEQQIVGLPETCGGAADLAWDGRTTYHLAAMPAEACADLARIHPLPEPGCYGVAYARTDSAGSLSALTLRLSRPELPGGAPTYPWLEGVMSAEVARSARGVGDLAGARVMLPVWCSAVDGACRSGPEDGAFAVMPQGDGLALESSLFLLFDSEGAMVDITRGRPVRHLLSRLPGEACEDLVLE